jgi:hypothetical protein
MAAAWSIAAYAQKSATMSATSGTTASLPQIEVARVKPVDQVPPNVRLSDDVIDLMKAFSLSSAEGNHERAGASLERFARGVQDERRECFGAVPPHLAAPEHPRRSQSADSSAAGRSADSIKMKLPHRGNFCIWLRTLPRCRRCRASLARKPIRRGRCASSRHSERRVQTIWLHA